MIGTGARRWGWRTAALTLVTLTVLAPRVSAKSDDRVDHQGTPAVVEGKSLAEWSAVWWQWVLSIPVATDSKGNVISPLGNDDGATGLVGQSGNVIFLCGNWVPKTRHLTIPTNKWLFFPIINYLDDNATTLRGPFGKADMLKELKGWVADFDPMSVYCTLDERPIRKQDVKLLISPFFDYWLPPIDNLYGNLVHDPPLPTDPEPYYSGWMSPAISGGYWVMLRPLPVGHHTLASGGSTIGNTQWGKWSISATYDITVVSPAG